MHVFYLQRGTAARQQADDEQHDEDEEHDLGQTSRTGGDAAEAENCCDECDDEQSDGGA